MQNKTAMRYHLTPVRMTIIKKIYKQGHSPSPSDVYVRSFLCPLFTLIKLCYTKALDSVGEGEGGMFQENSIETCILSRVKQITSPGWMHETSAWTRCTGKTQRDQVEREVGGGIRKGNTCKSMAESCQCMKKTTTIL